MSVIIKCNRITETFEKCKSYNRLAFVAYITGGFDNQSVTLPMLFSLESSNVDIIEIGIPFSDPLAG